MRPKGSGHYIRCSCDCFQRNAVWSNFRLLNSLHKTVIKKMSLWNFLPLLKWELLFCVFWTFDGPYQICELTSSLLSSILLNICISANVFVLIIYVRMLDQMLSWLLPACHISFVLSITIVTLHYHGVQYTFLILPPSSRSQNHKLDAVAVLF